SRDAGALRDRACAGGRLALQLVVCGGNFLAGGEVAQTPPSHSKCFGKAADQYHTVLYTVKLCAGLVLTTKINVIVDFIRDDVDIWMPLKHFCQSLQLRLAVYAAGGIAGRREHKELGFWRDGRFQFFRRDFEVAVDGRVDKYGLAFRERYHFRIRNPV